MPESNATSFSLRKPFGVPLMTHGLEAFAFARAALFQSEKMMGPIVDLVIRRKRPTFVLDDPKLFEAARKSVFALLRRDVANITAGFYPPEVLIPENPVKHLLRLPSMLKEIVDLSRRRELKQAHKFSKSAEALLEGLPEYYQRNFHFQDDGYLSERSADLYEHQVEILFSGAADAMRRLIIPQMKAHFGKDHDGHGLTFLEIGAGTGRGTKFVRLAFPKAKIVAVDLSAPYLKRAQRELKKFNRHDFLEANGSDLPFKNETFDSVYSIFLFHELPMEERKAVLKESARVLKENGFHGLLDSLQLGDEADFDSALELFPQQFHEPFYKNYIQHPVQEILEQSGLPVANVEIGFFSKSVSSVKHSKVVPVA